MKTTIKTWLIIILLVTNLATIVSFSYQRTKINRQLESNYPMRPSMNRQMGGRFILNEMNLDEKQKEAFINHHQKFQYNARKIARSLDIKRNEFMQELALEKPNQKKLENIADEIGKYHKNLKMETVYFYQSLKEECRPDQLDELNTIFMELSSPGRRMMPNNRNRNNRGQRYQRGMNKINNNRQYRNQY